jgi:hypothetical protein
LPDSNFKTVFLQNVNHAHTFQQIGLVWAQLLLQKKVRQYGVPFRVGALEFEFQLWQLAVFDYILVSIATTVVVRVTLTVHHVRILAFTPNKPHIQFVRAFLLHLHDHEFTAPASGLDGHDAPIHVVALTSSQGFNRRGVQARGC